MRQLRALRRRTWPDRLLLAQAGVVVIAVRLMLTLVPFRAWKDLIVQPPARAAQGQGADAALVSRVTAAVRTTSRYVPAATCLTQALATQLLLAWRGHATKLKIGVAKGADGQFQAHAWVEWGGKVIIGGANSPAQFTIIPTSESSQL